MKNTYNLGLLRRRILEALPRQPNEAGTRALEAFLALPGASAWRPERLWLKELSYVFDIGLPFALIGENPSVKLHSLWVGEAIRFGEAPPRDLWSEIHAAALLSQWGADVRLIADARTAAHGLEIRLPGGEALDVEVTRSDAAPLSLPHTRPFVIAIDVKMHPDHRDQVDAALKAGFAGSPQLSGVLLFEPRFWIGIEQKEWVHSAHVNAQANVPIDGWLLGNADGHRHALRIPLLI